MDIIVRAIVIYLFVWLVLRALGKRELTEMTSFELVLLFVIGDLVQQSITQHDTSVTAAILAISTISVLILGQSYATFRWKRSRPVLEGEPVVVINRGVVLTPVLRRERMTTEDLASAARGHGIDDLAHVRVAIIEADGKLSFVTVGGEPVPQEMEERRAE
jgi:uncharacterized membrane protein YcaP (DUF421 family)